MITKIEGDRGTDNTRYSSGDPQSMTPYTASMCEMAIMEVDGRGNGKDSKKGNGLVTESLQKVIFSTLGDPFCLGHSVQLFGPY